MIDAAKITRLLRWEMNELVVPYLNKSLPYQLGCKTDRFYQAISNEIDWENLTVNDYIVLGFMRWELDDNHDLWLIPQWLYPIIPEGLHVVGTNKDFFKFSRVENMLEAQYGMLKFGFLQYVETRDLQ